MFSNSDISFIVFFSSFVRSKVWCVTFDLEEGQGDVPSGVPDDCIYKGFFPS